MRPLALPVALALLGACGGSASPVFNGMDAGSDAGLPPLDAPAADRPDRATPEVVDLTDAPPADAPASDVPCAPNLPGVVRFGREGGLSPSTVSFTLSPPATFRAERRNAGSTAVVAMCETPLAPCNTADTVDLGEVNAALAAPGVAAALGMGRAMPILYGTDTRPADGQVFVVEADGGRVLVGATCRVGMSTTCLEVPTALQRLVDVLAGLAEQELSRAACAAVRR